MAAGKRSSPSKKKRAETYKSSHQREKNKVRRILRHLKKHPNDTFAQSEITRIQAIISKK